MGGTQSENYESCEKGKPSEKKSFSRFLFGFSINKTHLFFYPIASKVLKMSYIPLSSFAFSNMIGHFGKKC